VLHGSCVQSDDHSVLAAAPSAAAPSAAATSAPPQRPGETEAQPRAYPVGMVTTLPYGSWPSPISAELLATGGTRLGGPQLVGDEVWWTEASPPRRDGTRSSARTAPCTAPRTLRGRSPCCRPPSAPAPGCTSTAARPGPPSPPRRTGPSARWCCS